MKKLFVSVVLVIGVAFVFASPALAAPVAQDVVPAEEGGVTLPVEIENLIVIVIGLLVTQGLKSISHLVGKDISGWGSALTASIAMSVIFFFNALLSAIPEAAQPSVAVALTLIVTILASFGLKDTLKSFQHTPGG
jgi:predicted anti-sigma-YlaC factor YlaD